MKNDSVGDTYMTVSEVADLLRVSKMTVYRMVHSGEIFSVRFGKSFRLPKRSVDQYLRGSVNSSTSMIDAGNSR